VPDGDPKDAPGAAGPSPPTGDPAAELTADDLEAMFPGATARTAKTPSNASPNPSTSADPTADFTMEDLKALLPPPTGQKEMWRAVAIVALIFVVVLAFGWYAGWFSPVKGAGPPPCPTALEIQGAGSSSLAPVVSAWETSLAKSTGCYQINYNGTGSAAGLSGLTSKNVEYLATDAPLNATEFAGVPAPVVTLPVALVGIAVAYNVPGVPAGLHLDGSVLAGMYLGTVTEWNDPAILALNPVAAIPSGLPVVPVHLSDSGGTTRVFSEFLADQNGTWNQTTGGGENPRWTVGSAATSDAALAASVAATPGEVGYAAWGATVGAHDTVADLPAESGGYVPPNATSISAATPTPSSLPGGNASWASVSLLDRPASGAYPLTAFAYLITYTDLGSAFGANFSYSAADWLAYFFIWASLHGMNYTTPLMFDPLSSAQSTADIQTLEMMNYHGVHLTSDIDKDHDPGGTYDPYFLPRNS
jgi:phosphate transport system substrate-binding protein